MALPEVYTVYATAYIMLDRERRDDHAHIPWSAFVNYGTFYGFNRDQIDMLIEIGFRVDDAVLADRAKKAKQAAKHGNT